MFGFLFKKIFGSKNERYLRRLRPQVQRINALEPEMQQLDDADFAARIARYKEEVQEGGKSLDSLLPEVFALVREASRRVLGMRHYDVQLVGGMVLHKGKIAEMKTGEGKTLVATLAVVLNALSGKGVHVVTVNDYLASRDAAWMGKLYSFLGLSTGVIVHGLDDDERKTAYNADITYGTNNEFGFDYLRDNMKFYAEQLVQRGHNFAIVDEVDSILIDEARTPLIISGASEESVGMYRTVDDIVRQLTPEHFTIDEKARTAMLTDAGVLRCEELLKLDNLFDPANITAQHHVLHDVIHVALEDLMGLEGLQNVARPTSQPSTTFCNPSRPIRSSSATWITSCRTIRWSSWTSSPAASWPDAAIPTACTRPWKPRST